MQGAILHLRRMCLHGPAWPAGLPRLYASHATEVTHQLKPDSQPPVGGYTPITTALWLERLQHGATGGATSESTASKTVVYKFSTDKIMRELYRNPWDYVRIGKIMEDLDSLAGSIAFQHCFTPGQPPTLLVTASVDEITLTHPISTDQDVTMQGSVAWTGSSSLDILMTITQPQHTQPSLTSLFSFVNLNPKTRKAAPVRPITPTTPDQQALFQARQHVADARKRARHASAAHGAHLQGDTPEALAFMRPLVSKHRQLRELPALVAAGGAVVLEDTHLTNTFIAMPQHRNTHGRIFGGWLMGLAYELAFATTYTFSGQRPVFLKCDEIVFKKPVDVGDLLRFHSTVLHAVRVPEKKGLVCVEVEAIVATPAREEPAVDVTNSFMFVFQVADHPTAGPVKQVLPSNDEEARKAWDCHQALLDAGYLPPGDK